MHVCGLTDLALPYARSLVCIAAYISIPTEQACGCATTLHAVADTLRRSLTAAGGRATRRRVVHETRVVGGQPICDHPKAGDRHLPRLLIHLWLTRQHPAVQVGQEVE